MPRATPADRYELAHHAWEILVKVAKQPDWHTITYGKLAAELNKRTGRNLSGQHMHGPLTLIMDYCDRHTLPRLNDLAVSQARQWPSYEPEPGYNFATERKRVLAYPWHTHTVSPDDFAPPHQGSA